MAYSIEEGDRAQHKHVLLDLWQRNFPGIAEGRFAWIYENNPCEPPTILLLKHEASGSFVGALTLFPRQIFVRSLPIKAYICGDMVVDAKHRTLGPATLLLKAAIAQCCKEPLSILLSFPIAKSEKVALRAGFKVLGKRHEMTKIIRSSECLQRYMQSKFAVRSLAPLFDSVLILFDTVLHVRLSNRYQWQVVDAFDQRFDEFWESISDRYEMIGERSSQYLNWRIKESPCYRSRVFALFAHSSLCGYIVFTRRGTRCQIVDLAYGGNTEQLRTLLSLFTRYQRSLGAEAVSITITGNGSIVEQFKKQGFSIRNMESKVVYYSSQADFELAGSGEKGVWYLTDADNDI